MGATRQEARKKENKLTYERATQRLRNTESGVAPLTPPGNRWLHRKQYSIGRANVDSEDMQCPHFRSRWFSEGADYGRHECKFPDDGGYIYCKYCDIYGYHQSEVCNYPHLIVGHTPPFETVDKKGP